MIVDSLDNNLIVDNVNRLKIRINEKLNVKVETTANNEEELRGNVKWNTTQIE